MQLLKVFKKFTNQIFGIKEVEHVYPILKTTAQLVAEGKGAQIPGRRYRNTNNSYGTTMKPPAS